MLEESESSSTKQSSDVDTDKGGNKMYSDQKCILSNYFGTGGQSLKVNQRFKVCQKSL